MLRINFLGAQFPTLCLYIMSYYGTMILFFIYTFFNVGTYFHGIVRKYFKRDDVCHIWPFQHFSENFEKIISRELIFEDLTKSKILRELIFAAFYQSLCKSEQVLKCHCEISLSSSWGFLESIFSFQGNPMELKNRNNISIHVPMYINFGKKPQKLIPAIFSILSNLQK